jgi:FAD:protein FMN transferase
VIASYLKKKESLRALFFVCIITFLSSCFELPETVELHSIYGNSMGTSYSIKIIATENQKASLESDIESYLSDFNQIMSTYIKDSDLSKLNDAPSNEWIELDPDLFEVIELAQQISTLSDGAFDITVAPLVDLWGFGPTQKPDQIPGYQDIKLMLNMIGFDQLELNSVTKSIIKHEQRRLDLSSIAKGFGVDKVAEMIEAEGITAYMVEIGGEFRLSGVKPNDKKWVIGIETPDSGAQGAHRLLELTDLALATSGDYRNYFESDGVRYSHTLNPNTGRPITHDLISVTVAAKSSAKADALATALNVMGFEAAKALAKELDIAVYLIRKTDDGFDEYASQGFELLLK